MTHEDEINSLVGEMVCLVDNMRTYAVKKTIDHDTLCRCLAEDAADFERLVTILRDELGVTIHRTVQQGENRT